MAGPNYEHDLFFKNGTFCWLTTDRSACILTVRSQEVTDSCYAFVVADTIYAVQCLNGDVPYHCSEQELLDHLYKNYPPAQENYKDSAQMVVGKKGLKNNYENAFRYVMEKGISTAEDYPFVGKHQGFQNPAPISGVKIFVEGFDVIPDNRHDLVVQKLHEHPVGGSLIIGKGFRDWKPHMGVYEGLTAKEQEGQDKAKEEGENRLYCRHAVTLVGYGVDDGKDYYICKNSYGQTWGHRGYVKILREIVRHFYYPVRPLVKNKRMKKRKN